ncbi:MAG: biotin/lipoyl-binding protein, partial [Variovorax sp.]
MTTLNTEILEKADEALDQAAKLKRKRRLIALGATVLTLGTGYATYSHFYASKFISTDNAYTATETAQVTPSVGGIVREVRVTDTSYVHKGDVLVVLDDIDARLALAQAEAELGRAQRRVHGYVANDASLAAQLAARASDEKRALADLDRAVIDLERRENLADSGSVSGDELTKARNAHASAKAALAQARSNYSAAIGSRSANAVLIANSTEYTNPDVALAR